MERWEARGRSDGKLEYRDGKAEEKEILSKMIGKESRTMGKIGRMDGKKL